MILWIALITLFVIFYLFTGAVFYGLISYWVDNWGSLWTRIWVPVCWPFVLVFFVLVFLISKISS